MKGIPTCYATHTLEPQLGMPPKASSPVTMADTSQQPSQAQPSQASSQRDSTTKMPDRTAEVRIAPGSCIQHRHCLRTSVLLPRDAFSGAHIDGSLEGATLSTLCVELPMLHAATSVVALQEHP
jgi:hypothetical protein